jgi:biotin operon repressor
MIFYKRRKRKMNTQNRDFKGVWIPKEIYLNDDLNWTDKILFIEIDSLDNNHGCFASNAYFAKFLRVSETTISTSISKLKALGLIYQESFNGRERVLHSNLKPTKIKKIHEPVFADFK